MGIAVDLAVAREHEGPGEAGLGVGAALVDMDRDDADRADLAGAGDVEPVGGARDGIGGRQRALVRDRPQRLAVAALIAPICSTRSNRPPTSPPGESTSRMTPRTAGSSIAVAIASPMSA